MDRTTKMAFCDGKSYNVINGGHEQHLIQALRVSRLWGPPQSMTYVFGLTQESRTGTKGLKVRDILISVYFNVA